MDEPPEELLAAVRDQAEARVRMDVQGVVKYLTPEAVDTLRASFPGVPPRVNAHEVVSHESRGVDHVFEVRYSARDTSFVVRSRWRKLEEGWMAVHAERLWAEGEKGPGVLSRLLGSLLRALGRLRRGR
ncbi:MAG: hypothetical protein E3J29_03635 [Dehalococcoidia bacterium]|nr:MAG: hypothetical protein E3J29_03635 [Dehalococcoidia bacterium]